MFKANNYISAAKSLWGDLVNLFLPNECCHCGDFCDSGGFCADCFVKLAELTAHKYCPRCAAALGENIAENLDGCTQCSTPMPRYERAIRLGSFESPLSDAITALKFNSRSSFAAVLGRFLAQRVKNAPLSFEIDIACAVPLYWRRRLRRGYNQSELLARTIARDLQIPCSDELKRLRDTTPQLGLSRKKRLENVKGAFEAKNPARIKDLTILLVDDVSTTGATANEAAKALLLAGAARVILAVAAKAEAPEINSKVKDA